MGGIICVTIPKKGRANGTGFEGVTVNMEGLGNGTSRVRRGRPGFRWATPRLVLLIPSRVLAGCGEGKGWVAVMCFGLTSIRCLPDDRWKIRDDFSLVTSLVTFPIRK